MRKPEKSLTRSHLQDFGGIFGGGDNQGVIVWTKSQRIDALAENGPELWLARREVPQLDMPVLFPPCDRIILDRRCEKSAVTAESHLADKCLHLSELMLELARAH